jgi:L-threonylcarbamoyladenylate synthase
MNENSLIGILPTDTIYGIVGPALDKMSVERIYRLRKRNLKKPMIILIASVDDLARFGVATTPAIKKILKKVWPGKVSVILPCTAKKFEYLHRGTKTLAFRLPQLAWLRNLIKETGPLVAPSANIEGKPPARTIRAARKYFGDKVDFYVDVGRLVSKPSTIVKIEKGQLVLLRKGAVKVRGAF